MTNFEYAKKLAADILEFYGETVPALSLAQSIMHEGQRRDEETQCSPSQPSPE